MRFLLSGASGFIGGYLTEFLRASGHETVRLVRGKPATAGEVYWNPNEGLLDMQAFAGVGVVVNMNGASIAGRRWSKAYKQELIDSRQQPTRLLATTLAGLSDPPPVFISFSAAGYYGHHPLSLECDETTPAAHTFLAQVCERWEATAQPAVAAGIHVVHPRLGVVIGNGGMLEKLLPLFRLGLGGRLGSGRQALSWIAQDDIGPAFLHCLAQGLAGPVNFSAPQAVTNAEFTRALARQLHRPALLPVPAFALRLAVGEVAEELLNGANVVPRCLLGNGYSFRCATLAETLARYVPQLLERR